MRKNPKDNKLETSQAMAKMRNIAYGNAMKVHIHRTLDEAGKRRDDASILALAETKRLRKAAKRIAQS